MKNFLILAALCVTPAAAFAGPNASQQINNLPNGAVKSALIELNNEDQRVTDGTYDAATGTLTLYTQDMKAGADGDISRRAVVIEGIVAERGETGAAGADGLNFDYAHVESQMSADRALGSLQLRTALDGQFTGGVAIAGGDMGPSAFSGGVAYGLSDDFDVWVSGSTAFEGGGWNVAAGATWVFK